jgi:hypothetical protein
MADTKATFGASVLDAQLDAIKVDAGNGGTGATKVGLCVNYARADDFATADGKIIAFKVIDTNDAFWGARTNDDTGVTDDTDAPSRRQACTPVELLPATGTANGSTDELSLLLLSATEVLAVVNESSVSRAVSVDDVITTFSFYIQASQPGTV